MTYAYVTGSTISNERGRPPDSATLLSDPGQWVTSLEHQTVAVQRSTGWYEVAATARPADTGIHTHERSLTLVGGVPTETWTQRAWTAAELLERERPAKISTLAGRARTFLTQITNRKAAIVTDQANAQLTAHMGLAALAGSATLAQNTTRTQQIDLTLKQLIPIVNRLLAAQDGVLTFARDQIYLDGELVTDLRDLADGSIP